MSMAMSWRGGDVRVEYVWMDGWMDEWMVRSSLGHLCVHIEEEEKKVEKWQEWHVGSVSLS
jgi:hypothetical protein